MNYDDSANSYIELCKRLQACSKRLLQIEHNRRNIAKAKAIHDNTENAEREIEQQARECAQLAYNDIVLHFTGGEL